jgi:hypothetical protein
MGFRGFLLGGLARCREPPEALTHEIYHDMSRHMRTTVRLDDALLNQARHEAARRGETLTALIEEGLRRVLAQSRMSRRRQRVVLPSCRAGGGVLPGVDLNDTAAVLEIMEGRG